MIEQRLDFSRWVENGFGTGDCVIVADEVLQIIDYKHGLGVQSLLNHDLWILTEFLGCFDLFQNIIPVFLCAVLHFSIVECQVFCRISDSSAKSFFHKIGAQLMTIGSLLCIFGCLIRNIGTELSLGGQANHLWLAEAERYACLGISNHLCFQISRRI